MSAVAAVHNATLRPDLDALVRPGERRYALVVATREAQARDAVLGQARLTAEASPLLAPMIEAVTRNEIRFTLPSGAKTAVRVMPASARGLRGYPCSLVVLDEAAHFQLPTDEGEGDSTAEAIWTAVRPTLAQFGPAARLVMCSTPAGDDGLFAQVFRQASAGELPGAVAVHATSQEMNPTLDAAQLEQARALDESAYDQEYLALFTSPQDAFLDWSRVQVADRGPLAPGLAHIGFKPPLVAGLDVAFSSDPTGLAIIGRDPHDHDRLLLLRSRAIPSRGGADGFEHTMGEVLDELKAYGCRQVCIDQYSSEAVAARLRAAGIACHMEPITLPMKTSMFVELRDRLYGNGLEIHRDELLRSELRRARQKRAATGGKSVFIPRLGGSHGDVACALAYAVYHQRRVSGAYARQRGDGGGMVTRGVLSVDVGGPSKPDPDRKRAFVRRDEPLMSGLLDQDL